MLAAAVELLIAKYPVSAVAAAFEAAVVDLQRYSPPLDSPCFVVDA